MVWSRCSFIFFLNIFIVPFIPSFPVLFDDLTLWIKKTNKCIQQVTYSLLTFWCACMVLTILSCLLAKINQELISLKVSVYQISENEISCFESINWKLYYIIMTSVDLPLKIQFWWRKIIKCHIIQERKKHLSGAGAHWPPLTHKCYFCMLLQ